ncbi:hypothetical protein Acy02nite_90510 [Actinoplanes cyaneus]|uniref:Nudix hydrolase domain-containing protein n=1 Tax=Actinoplanes cyaneus TaxID=52696 RepID=A0A919IZW1_9ACTN|nr:NUDIX domain-containing protein [Actinoplanes cyaneus]MCW2144472.1 ADP-ribose pyrophosphatase YjhB, NUDIX family [Actinoplanes cyaneus]GID71170.1 hypothetical protein Acy02nite_90510 [Actinoplanes cyaneus]
MNAPHQPSAAAPRHPVDVFLLLHDGPKVLLALRAGTGYADGERNLVSGKLETGETALAGVRREAAEEVGLRLGEDDVHFTATVHHRNRNGQGRIGLVFTAAFEPGRHGEPVNAEPHKCAGIEWFPFDELPAETDRYTLACVAAWRSGERLHLSGW